MCLLVWVPCCDVRYDLLIKAMFGSSLPPVVCMMTHVLFTFIVFVCALYCSTHIGLCILFGCLCPDYLLPVSVDDPYFIVPLIFSDVYLSIF